MHGVRAEMLPKLCIPETADCIEVIPVSLFLSVELGEACMGEYCPGLKPYRRVPTLGFTATLYITPPNMVKFLA